MSKIIISQPWGGLGDNLHFSTLPELFSKKGHEVYISENNAVRNAEIFDFTKNSRSTIVKSRPIPMNWILVVFPK